MEMEAGPFTPHEAKVFAETETVKKAFQIGRPWVCDYTEIIDAGRRRKAAAGSLDDLRGGRVRLLLDRTHARQILGRHEQHPQHELGAAHENRIRHLRHQLRLDLS
jgi:hypothetical protein